MNEFKKKTMTQITQFKWFAKPDANDHVYEMLQPAVRYKRDDCVELPEVSYKTIDIPPSKQVSDTYKKLIKLLRTAFTEGRISAANEGVLFMKLLQIACGWVYTDQKKVVRLDNQSRVDEVKDIIDQSLGKVIVFASFSHACVELHQRLLKKKVDCALIHGGTSKKERDNIFGCFMNSPHPKVLVANPKTMSHGLTLTQANTIVWFTPTTSLETYEQANARITRPGQTRKSLIIHLTGSPIETKIYNRLQQKASLQGALLDMFDDN
jgi:SNF2 family DNA or RNA helicase